MLTRTGIILAALTTMGGCNSSLFNQHVKDMEIMRGVAAEIAQRLGNSSMGQAAGSLQGQNPGIMVEFGTKYFGVVRYDGVAGALTFAAAGQLDRTLTPEQLATIEAIYNDTTLTSAAKRAQLMEVIRGVMPLIVKPLTTQPGEPVGLSGDPNIPDPRVPKRVGLSLVRANRPATVEE